MPAPLFSHLLVRLPRPVVVVPLLAAAFLAGCPEEEPPPVEVGASLKFTAERTRVTLGESADVTFKSTAKGGAAATGDVTITVGPVEGDEAPGEATVGVDEASALSDSVSITPSGGAGGFVVRCGATPGKVQVTGEATDTGETAAAVFNCVQVSNFFYAVSASVDVACTRLQADGVSSCPVTLTVTKQPLGSNDPPAPAANETVDVEVLDVSEVVILDGVRGVSVDGIREVLAPAPSTPLSERIPALQTDDDGKARFLVVSPAFGVSETVTIQASSQGITKNLPAFTIAPFENQSGLSMTASKSELESGRTSTLTVVAQRTDGAPAAGERVTLSSVSSTPAIFTAAASVTVTNGIATLTLDDAGAGSVVVTAPDVVGRGVPVPVQVIYDTGVDANTVPPLASSLTLSVSERGSVIGNADFTSSPLLSDEPNAAPVRFFVTAESGEEPFGDVAVNLVVAPDSQALIRFGGDRGGTDPVRRSLPSLSAAAAGALGRAEFLIVPVSPIARGTATVNVQMTQNGNTIFQASRTLVVARDPILQSVVFVAADPPVIGVRGGTQPSTASVTFRLVDDTGAPLAGVPVRFVTNATADRGVSVEQSDISASDGIVQTTLSAGTIAGPVTVVVTALPSNGLPITVESASIAIIGGLPTFLNSDLVCDKRSGQALVASCTAQLVDRFTNRVGPDTQVQFKAEGGSITPASATDADGASQGTFVTGRPGKPNAEVTAWSYGRPVRVVTDLAGFAGAAACTDSTTSTPCNLLQLCADPDTSDACPLPGRQSEPDLMPVTTPDGGVTFDVDETRRCDADLAENSRACGFPAGCLDGSGFDCNVNMGCFDFSPSTFCPQNGLATITASARGEESFLDGNGNGILDFIDVNNNGRHETGEPIGVACRVQRAGGQPGDPNCVLSDIVRDEGPCPQPGRPGFSGDLDATCRDGIRQVDDFIDSPEPFLDKNGSCSRDNFLYAGANGMTAIERQVASDLFSDVDGSLTFGFDPERDNVVEQTNGTWDRDTEIFLETHVLVVGAPQLLFGEACSPRSGTHTCSEATSPAGGTSPCVELANGAGIAPRCNPSLKVPQSNGDAGFYLYAWVDGNGNCPTTDFGASTTVSATGSAAASAQERQLDEGICGFGSGLDPDRPWCEVQPALGAPAFAVGVVFDCSANDALAAEETKLTFELVDDELASKEEFGLFVDPTTCTATP